MTIQEIYNSSDSALVADKSPATEEAMAEPKNSNEFLLVAYICYRHSDGEYHTPIGVFTELNEAWEFVLENGDSYGLNKKEDGGGTYFYTVGKNSFMEKEGGGFWFDTSCNFISPPEIPAEIDEKYTPY